MSLKNLLAVGESFSGTGSNKPYAVKERQIPIFATTEEPPPAPVIEKEGADLLPSVATKDEEPRAEKVHLRPEHSRIEQEIPERRSFLQRWSKPTVRKFTQAEMTLELPTAASKKNAMAGSA